MEGTTNGEVTGNFPFWPARRAYMVGFLGDSTHLQPHMKIIVRTLLVKRFI